MDMRISGSGSIPGGEYENVDKRKTASYWKRLPVWRLTHT